MVRLLCVRRANTGDDRNNRNQDVTVWDCQKTIGRDASSVDPTRMLLPVKFVIPPELPPSSDEVVPYWTTGVFGLESDGWRWLYWGGSEPQESAKV